MTTPVIAWAGAGPLATASLLYVGAVIEALAMRLGSRPRGAPLGRGDLPRVLAIAFVGAAVAPVCLAWGIALAESTEGSGAQIVFRGMRGPFAKCAG